MNKGRMMLNDGMTYVTDSFSLELKVSEYLGITNCYFLLASWCF